MNGVLELEQNLYCRATEEIVIGAAVPIAYKMTIEAIHGGDPGFYNTVITKRMTSLLHQQTSSHGTAGSFKSEDHAAAQTRQDQCSN